MARTNISDYLRLAVATPTVAKEFEWFKDKIFYPMFNNFHLHDPNIWGLGCTHSEDLLFSFDNYIMITAEEAAAIAYVKYYRANSAFILPENIRIFYFDIAVNLGNEKAIKLLQHCLNVPEDGVIGPVTREKMPFIDCDCLCYEKKGLLHLHTRLVKSIKNQFKKLTKWYLNIP